MRGKKTGSAEMMADFRQRGSRLGGKDEKAFPWQHKEARGIDFPVFTVAKNSTRP